jgi:hypothetical protein
VLSYQELWQNWRSVLVTINPTRGKVRIMPALLSRSTNMKVGSTIASTLSLVGAVLAASSRLLRAPAQPQVTTADILGTVTDAERGLLPV